MSAYVIVQIRVQDAATYERYKALAPPVDRPPRGTLPCPRGEDGTLGGELAPVAPGGARVSRCGSSASVVGIAGVLSGQGDPPGVRGHRDAPGGGSVRPVEWR